MEALQNELDKVKGERDEIYHNFVELSLKFENVGAEKLTALTQQALLEDKYNEIVSNALRCNLSWLVRYHPFFCRDRIFKNFCPHCC
jgi:hypothetical protein